MNPLRLLGRDVAIDLGAASTQIYVKGKGIVLNEPSVVTRSLATGKVVAVGADPAPKGETLTVRPVSGGLPYDGDLTRHMLRHFLKKAHGHPFARPCMVIALPSDPTGIIGDALSNMAYDIEARRVYLVHHGMAAAMGAGLPVKEATGNMVIDIGCDTTRIAVVSCGAVVAARSLPVGGGDVTKALVALVRREHGLVITEAAAEDAKRRKPLEVPAVDPYTGERRTVTISAELVSMATKTPAERIARAAADMVEGLSPDLALDIADRGAVLTGGGSLLRGLGKRLRQELGIPVQRAERPVESVALGLGRCVDDLRRIPGRLVIRP
ncbi:rod shape-determining protein [Nonomuraea sediminis]|uniref:rod shape-determining protein n=1 Tax=Nonomuraea sediminis TaxID=2835864 RepID=UPI001BDBE5E2|nr:rod shape-determining protein [Nonomuraea sediminis]